MAENKQLLLVLGMHRSGTSMIAEALHSGGLSVASRLIAADPEINARGYWEDEELVAINEDLFAALGSQWYDLQPLPDNWWTQAELDPLRERAKSHLSNEYGSDSASVIKDPRLSLLLPFWLPLFSELNFNVSALIVCRNPLAIARSLTRRDQLPQDYSLLLWFKYQRELARSSQQLDAALVEYESALSDINIINSALQSLSARLQLQTIDPAIADSSLQHCGDVEDANSEGAIASAALACHKQQLQELNIDWESAYKLDPPESIRLLSSLARDLVQSSGKQVEIGELHSDAQETVELRDQQLQQTQSELQKTSGLYQEAVANSERADATLKEVVEELELARKLIAERDQQLAGVNQSIEEQGKLLQHAENVVVERDGQLKEANALRDQLIAERSAAEGQRDEFEKRLGTLYERLQASIVGRLALRLIDRKHNLDGK